MWPVQAKDKTELKKIIEVLHFKMAENSMAYARSYVVRGKLYRRVDFFFLPFLLVVVATKPGRNHLSLPTNQYRPSPSPSRLYVTVSK